MAETPIAPEAQERDAATELLGRVRSLHAEIQQALGRSLGSSADSRLADIIARLAGAESQLTLALDSPGAGFRAIDLAALEMLIRGSEAAAAAAIQTLSAESSSRAMQELAAASAVARQEVQGLSRDLFERRIFDPFLHFSSPDDEAEYRARETERQRAIAAQLARGTPEGNLNAGGIAAGQMLDAHAHGAGASPDFLPRWNGLVEKLHQQRKAMLAAGHSTEEFDRSITADVRHYLKAKGLSEAEIDARLAAASSPLEAVRPYVTNERDARLLHTMVWDHAKVAETPVVPLKIEAADPSVGQPPTLKLELDAMSAKLQAAGVQMADAPPPPSGHGLATAEIPGTTVRGPG